MPLHAALHLIGQGRSLTSDQTADAFAVIMRGDATPTLIGGLLLGLRARGETADEVAGAARAMRAAMVAVRPATDRVLVDTCGTGGGTVSTFNISTAAALVAAAAGAGVPKHGNRSYTSKCGSADVLEALGVNILLDAEPAAAVLNQVGMVFLFAPTFHPAMRHVGPTRKELGVATIMNLLGPLTNPAGVERQVIGVADRSRAPLMAEALLRLGATRALVVHGEVGMDEVSPAGVTAVWEVADGAVRTWTLDPGDYDLKWDRLEDLAGRAPAENAVRIERLLNGEKDEAGRRAVLLNAAAALYVSGLAPDYAGAVELARSSLASGAAAKALGNLRAAAPR